MPSFRIVILMAALLALSSCAYPRSGYYDGVPYVPEGTAGRGIH